MKIDILNFLWNTFIGAGAGAGITFLLRTYFNEKIKNSIKHEYNIRIETYKSELKNAIDKDFESYKSNIKELESKNLDKWELKREACLRALNIADSAMSNLEWESDIDMRKGIVKSEIDTITARICYNQLACTCDLPETLYEFKRVLGMLGPIGGDAIVDFRNAIRKELNFGNEIDVDRKKAFIGRIHGDEK
jgi:hypothetical protein